MPQDIRTGRSVLMKHEPTQTFTQIMHKLPLKFEGKKKGEKKDLATFPTSFFFLIEMSFLFFLNKK